MKPTDTHRRVYKLLLDNPHGFTREELARRMNLGDRSMRKVIEEVRTFAATSENRSLGRPVVIGFDPEVERYVAAQDAETADRVVAYYSARLKPMLQTVRVQEQAARAYRPPHQEKLLGGKQ